MAVDRTLRRLDALNLPLKRGDNMCYFDGMVLLRDTLVIVSRNLGALRYVPALRAVLPSRVEATATSPSWDGEVVLLLVVEEGRVVVDEVRVRRLAGAPGVSLQVLRAIPVAAIARHAVRVAALPARYEDGKLVVQVIDAEGAPSVAQVVEREMPRRRVPGTRGTHREQLEEVAAAYRSATAAGVTHPRAHVAYELGYSSSHVGKLLHEARRTDPPLLGPAPGRGRPRTEVERHSATEKATDDCATTDCAKSSKAKSSKATSNNPTNRKARS